jgi:23S rRNA (uracil1939-C5)-methyltransferase
LLTHKIEITDLVFGGDGIGKLNGKVCFVPLSAPGDLVEVIITEEKKDYSRGQIQNILRASADRAVPPCQYFEKCGGCNWQHLAYPSQVKYKQQLVESHFRRSFGEVWKLRDFQISPLQFEYRNKIGLKWNGSKLGYFQKRSHEHLPIKKCLIADDSINNQIAPLENDLVKQSILPDKDKTYYLYSKAGAADAEMNFSQVNEQVNVLMKEDVLSLLPENMPSAFFDFYAGHGNFTFLIYEKLKEKFKTVSTIAVEYDATMARKGRLLAGKRKIQFFHAKVEDYLRREKIPSAAFVLLDPPRGGCDALVIDALLHCKAQKIVYVSCNPTTLHRDLKSLLKYNTYQLESLRCFDMFPQSDHVEVVAEIKLS